MKLRQQPLYLTQIHTILWLDQGTIYRNAQLRYTHIMYCTLWEECKQTQCLHRSWRERTKALMWNYSPKKTSYFIKRIYITFGFWLIGKIQYIAIFLFHPLGPFPSKIMRCPLILCFDLIPLQYTDGSWSIYFWLSFLSDSKR